MLISVTGCSGSMSDNDNNDYNDSIERRISRFLQSPHCAWSCLQHVSSRDQGAIKCKSLAAHQTLITCNISFASWARRDSPAIKFGRVKIAFILGLLGWLKPLNDEGGRDTEVPGENP